MMERGPSSDYVLGSGDVEHERLIRQAVFLNPLTDRLFREAGIGPGQRVLDLGSGVGEVAMVAARIVGPTGQVVGIERDPRSIARARSRVANTGLSNVTFAQSDLQQLAVDAQFDAVVGRFILEYLPDPAAVLRTATAKLRPDGVAVFHEPCWAPSLAVAPDLKLWTACALLIRESLQRSGANNEIGLSLHRVFEQAGMPAPAMRLEIPLGNGPEFSQRIYDMVCALRPRIDELQMDRSALGDFGTLEGRLCAEIAEAGSVVPFGVALVGAWARTAS